MKRFSFVLLLILVLFLDEKGFCAAALKSPVITGAPDFSAISNASTVRSQLGAGSGDLLSSGSYSNPSWITALAWSKLTGTPTTLAGYGIADGQPLDSDLSAIALLSTTTFGRSLLTAADAAAARTAIGAGTSSFDGVFASLTSKPTTLAGYGIANGVPTSGGTGTLDLSGYTVTLPNNLTLLFRKGTAAELASITLAESEPGYTTDTKTIYIGDGATVGGNAAMMLAGAQTATGVKTFTPASPFVFTGGGSNNFTPETFTIGAVSGGSFGTWTTANGLRLVQGSGGAASGGGTGGATGTMALYNIAVVKQGSGGASTGGTGGAGGQINTTSSSFGLLTFASGAGGASASSGILGGPGGQLQRVFSIASGNGGVGGTGGGGGVGGNATGLSFLFVGGNGGTGGTGAGSGGGGASIASSAIDFTGGSGGAGGTTGVGGDGGTTGKLNVRGGNGGDASGATAGGAGGRGGQLISNGGAASGATAGGQGGDLTLSGSGTIAGGSIVLSNGVNTITTSRSGGGFALTFLNTAVGTMVPAAIVTSSTPTTGGTVSWATNQFDETVYLTPAGTLATLTLSVPTSANSRIGQIVRVFTTQVLTAITMTGAGTPTFRGTALTTLAADAGAAWQCAAADVWIRLY